MVFVARGVFGGGGPVVERAVINQNFLSCLWEVLVNVSISKGSCRGDVRLVGDALTPVVVNQGGGRALDQRVLVQLQRRRQAAELTGQLAELLRVGQRLQHSVLTLQRRVSLVQLFDLLLQHLHLFANGVHQVALHQVLNARKGVN